MAWPARLLCRIEPAPGAANNNPDATTPLSLSGHIRAPHELHHPPNRRAHQHPDHQHRHRRLSLLCHNRYLSSASSQLRGRHSDSEDRQGVRASGGGGGGGGGVAICEPAHLAIERRALRIVSLISIRRVETQFGPTSLLYNSISVAMLP